MQSARAALPELDADRFHPESTPEGGQWDFSIGEFLFDLLPLHFEEFSGGDGGTLFGSPGADLAVEGALNKVGQSFRS